jgi:long-chain acyl-CoA synthetase
VKLLDCSEMNYFHLQTPPTGEICVRGPTVTKGYFKEPGQTAEVIDEQGWFHTGDIGRFMPNGTFQIIDRKKNIFKLSQGLYIAAEALEGMYALSPFVSQIWIPGDSTKSYVVAVVVPAEPYCRAWAEEYGLDSPMEELCKTQELHDVVLRDLQLIHKENGRPGYEMLKGILLEHEEWAPDTGLTSPTLKLKRPALRSKYAFRLKQLYDALDGKGAE